MRVSGVTMAVVGMMISAAPAWAHEGSHEGNEAEEQAEASTAGSERTITGEVVDVVCYLSHGKEGLGKAHASCGKKCISSGLPVAIRSGDQLYLASMKDHTPANATLADFAGELVTVRGTVRERDGQHVIEIADVQKASAAMYTCPMHPDVQQAGPGTCPKCGMALERKP